MFDIESIKKALASPDVRYYMATAGQGLMEPEHPMQPVAAATKQQIAAQQKRKLSMEYIKMFKGLLAGEGSKFSTDGKTFKFDGPSALLGDDVSELLKGGEDSLAGTLPGADAGQSRLEQSFLNPSASPLDISSASLVGLTPADVTQALQTGLGYGSLEQKKLSDIYKMIQTPQPGPAAPIETPGLGKLSLKQWSSLPTEDRSYYLYAASAKQKGEEVMSKEDWMAETDTSTRIQYLKELEKDEDLKALAIELSGGVKINLGEQAIQRGMGKDIAYVTGPKISQDILDDLDKDPERLREQPYVKKYMAQGMKYEEAQARARKTTHRAELHRQLQIAYDKLGKIVEYGRYGFEVDGKIVQRY